MKVEFKVNLGSRDAAAFQLDYAACTRGKSLDVTDEVGAKLCSRGFAVDVTPPEKPVAIKAVPPVIATQPKVVELKTSEPAAKPKGSNKPSV